MGTVMTEGYYLTGTMAEGHCLTGTLDEGYSLAGMQAEGFCVAGSVMTEESWLTGTETHYWENVWAVLEDN